MPGGAPYDPVFFPELTFELIADILRVKLGFIDQKHDLASHIRERLDDFSGVNMIKATEWRVHDNRATQWCIPL
jgi:hypothetical protein